MQQQKVDLKFAFILVTCSLIWYLTSFFFHIKKNIYEKEEILFQFRFLWPFFSSFSFSIRVLSLFVPIYIYIYKSTIGLCIFICEYNARNLSQKKFWAPFFIMFIIIFFVSLKLSNATTSWWWWWWC